MSDQFLRNQHEEALGEEQLVVAALRQERMAWAALSKAEPGSPEQVVLQALWRNAAERIRELSLKLNS